MHEVLSLLFKYFDEFWIFFKVKNVLFCKNGITYGVNADNWIHVTNKSKLSKVLRNIILLLILRCLIMKLTFSFFSLQVNIWMNTTWTGSLLENKPLLQYVCFTLFRRIQLEYKKIFLQYFDLFIYFYMKSSWSVQINR